MFLWTPAPGATGYTLQVFTGAGALVSSTPLTLVEAQCPRNTGACGYTLPSALARRSAYTWRVSGSNAAGTGPYSASVAFVTP